MKPATTCAVLVLLTAAGCAREAPRAASTDEAAKFAALELTCEWHDHELQAEISLLKADGDLPLQLDVARGIAPQSSNSHLTTALTTAFSSTKLMHAREKSQVLFVNSLDRWNPLALEKALQFRATHAQAQQNIAQAIATTSTPLNLPLGGGAKLAAVCADAALVDVRLECISAADAVSRGDVDQALAAIRRAFDVVELLAAEPHVVTRLTAVEARRDVLGAVQRLVDSRVITAVQLAQLERILSQELARWPDDGDVWIGDRANGLQTYEMIRRGQLLAVLTDDELHALASEMNSTLFAVAVAKNVDRDETYYLQAMRRYIELSHKPYYERMATLDALQADFAALASSPDYPIIADRLLLAGLAQGQRQQAADLALVRAWSMALAVACGQSLPPPAVNPLTGQNYNVQIAKDRVVVAGIDPLQPEFRVTAPIATAARISSRRNFVAPHQPR